MKLTSQQPYAQWLSHNIKLFPFPAGHSTVLGAQADSPQDSGQGHQDCSPSISNCRSPAAFPNAALRPGRDTTFLSR